MSSPLILFPLLNFRSISLPWSPNTTMVKFPDLIFLMNSKKECSLWKSQMVPKGLNWKVEILSPPIPITTHLEIKAGIISCVSFQKISMQLTAIKNADTLLMLMTNMGCAPPSAHVDLPCSSKWPQCMALHANITICVLCVTSCLLMHILAVPSFCHPSQTMVTSLYTYLHI